MGKKHDKHKIRRFHVQGQGTLEKHHLMLEKISREIICKFPQWKTRWRWFYWSLRYFLVLTLGRHYLDCDLVESEMGKGERRGSKPENATATHPPMAEPRSVWSSLAAHRLATSLILFLSTLQRSAAGSEQGVQPRAGSSTQAGRHFQGIQVFCQLDYLSHLSTSHSNENAMGCCQAFIGRMAWALLWALHICHILIS